MKLKIGFTGDIAFSEYTKSIIDKKNAINRNILDYLNENNFNILNFESPITNSNITTKKALAHKSSPENLKFIIANIKKPIFSFANNHMMDFGIKGLLDTINIAQKENISFIGVGKNQEEATDYIIIGEEVKIGIISFQYKKYLIATENTPGTAHDIHRNIIKSKIKELKSKVDWIVVFYHGGEEFLNVPMPYTRKKYHKFLKWGADIVIAHHPHTVQGFEKLPNQKMIFYSLGNFIFDTDFQRAQQGTDEGVILNITFTKKNYSYKAIHLRMDRKNNRIKKEMKNPNFCDISKNYKQKWKNEIIKLTEIKKIKSKLKYQRNNYSTNNLHIKKNNNLALVSFDELVDKNYIPELEEKPKFKDRNIIRRKLRRKTKKIRKLKKIDKSSVIKKIYLAYAKLTTRKKYEK